jgi:hypothetical protein
MIESVEGVPARRVSQHTGRDVSQLLDRKTKDREGLRQPEAIAISSLAATCGIMR